MTTAETRAAILPSVPAIPELDRHALARINAELREAREAKSASVLARADDLAALAGFLSGGPDKALGAEIAAAVEATRKGGSHASAALASVERGYQIANARLPN